MADNEEQTPESSTASSPTANSGAQNGQKQGAAGPLNLEAIRRARMAQEQSTRDSQPDSKRRKGPNGPQGNPSGRSGPTPSKRQEVSADGQATDKGSAEGIAAGRTEAMDAQNTAVEKIAV
jgi:hypothetical protein